MKAIFGLTLAIIFFSNVNAQLLQFDSTGRLIGVPKSYYYLPTSFRVDVRCKTVESEKIIKERLKILANYFSDPNTIYELKTIGFQAADINSIKLEIANVLSGAATSATYFPWKSWLVSRKLDSLKPYSVQLTEKAKPSGIMTVPSATLAFNDTTTGYVSKAVAVSNVSEIKYAFLETPALPKIIKHWYDETAGNQMAKDIQMYNFYLSRIGIRLKEASELKRTLEAHMEKIKKMPTKKPAQVMAKNAQCRDAKLKTDALLLKVDGLSDTIKLAQVIRSDYLKFLLKWAWLNENLNFLNPFEKINSSGYIDNLSTQLASANDRLLQLTVRQNAIDAKISVLSTAIQIDRSRNFSDVAKIKDTIFSLTTKKGLLESAKTTVLENINELKKNASDVKPSELIYLTKTLNQGKIIYSESESKLNYARHHDFADGFERMNTDEDLYPDYYSVNIFLHNVPVSDTVTINVVTKAFKDQSMLLTDLGPAVKEITTLDFSGFPSMAFALESFSYKSLDSAAFKNKVIASTLDNCEDLNTSITRLNSKSDEVQKQLQFLNKKKVFMPTFPTFVDKKGILFRTEIKKIDSIQSSKEVTYTLSTKKSKDNFKGRYRIGKTFRFLPSAGYVYSFINFPKLEVKDNTVAKVGEYGGVIGTVGIKTYLLQKTFLANRESIFKSKGEVNRGMFFIYTGVSVPKSKDNYLVGGGFDIVSGASLNLGLHISKLKQPLFENGSFNGSYNNFYRTSGYIGLTLDPAVVVDLIKLF